MNRVLIYFINIFIILFCLGCGDNQQVEQKGETKKTTIKFILNDGEKWQMDAHTRTAIKNLDSLLKSQEPIKSLEEYNQLGEKLDEELILLIRGCTMEGPDHDQLHVFLGYFYPKVQSLKKETTVDTAEKILNEMKNLFTEYHKHFE